MTTLQKPILRGVSESVQTASIDEQGVKATPPAEALANRYVGDAGLLALYKKKLPKRGWAGRLDAVERSYVRWARQTRRQ